jgi:hypothetical protein
VYLSISGIGVESQINSRYFIYYRLTAINIGEKSDFMESLKYIYAPFHIKYITH